MGRKRENRLLYSIVEMQKEEIARLKGAASGEFIGSKTLMVNRLGGTDWATAPTATIIDLLKEHYAGKLSIYDYWGIGDERGIDLEGEIEQTIQMVLTDKMTNELLDGKKCAFSVDQKNCLKDMELPMNESDTNEGGWEKCKMRKWINSTYSDAFPCQYKELFKMFVTEHSIIDRFALRSETELFGKQIYGPKDQGRQIEYYKNTRNRIKLNGADDAESWWYWERSPSSGDSSYFCYVGSDGSASYSYASNGSGLAPFGCI